MPPRWVSLAIVLFWLGTTGPLVWREVRPLFLQRQPPPVTIELADEAQGEKAAIRWIVHVGPGEPSDQIGSPQAESWVEFHDAENTFTLHTRLRPMKKPIAIAPSVGLRRMHFSKTVHRDGRLRTLRLELLLDVLVFQVGIDLRGREENGELALTADLDLPPAVPPQWVVLGRELLQSPRFRLPDARNVYQPMELFNRIRGLRAGQVWDVPMIDPAQTGSGLLGLGKVAPSTVEARVLPQPQGLPGHPDIQCLVIEYDTEIRPRTWVQVETGYLMRQEVVYNDTRVVIQRSNLHPDR